eukprot:SAG31_NODE_40832_length_279_cov_0.566667_1_plen_54_part_10
MVDVLSSTLRNAALELRDAEDVGAVLMCLDGASEAIAMTGRVSECSSCQQAILV